MNMKVSELIEELQKLDANAEVWLPNVNELHIPGCCLPLEKVDSVMSQLFPGEDTLYQWMKIYDIPLKKKDVKAK